MTIVRVHGSNGQPPPSTLHANNVADTKAINIGEEEIFRLVDEDALPPKMRRTTISDPSSMISKPFIQHRHRPDQERSAISEFSNKGTMVPSDGPPEGLLHIATVLQRAARQVQNDETWSQKGAFEASIPLILFAVVFTVGLLLPRHYPFLQVRLGPNCNAIIISLIAGTSASLLFLVRAMIWVVGVLWQSFCEMDLVSTLRQGECRSADGTRMREGELVIGSFLFG